MKELVQLKDLNIGDKFTCPNIQHYAYNHFIYHKEPQIWDRYTIFVKVAEGKHKEWNGVKAEYSEDSGYASTMIYTFKSSLHVIPVKDELSESRTRITRIKESLIRKIILEEIIKIIK